MQELEIGAHDYPLALSAAYPIGKTNEAIRLYEGPLQLTYEQAQAAGDGSVYFKWFPSPYFEFQFSHHDVDFCLEAMRGGPLLGKAFLQLPRFEGVEVGIVGPTSFSFDNKRAAIGTATYTSSTTGYLSRPVVFLAGQDSQRISYVLFHLTNFHNFPGHTIASNDVERPWSGRVVMEAAGWKVTLDAVNTIDDLVHSLRSLSGFAVTHVGRFERTNGEVFTFEEAAKILEALHYFFSFARGIWSGPILPVGYQANGESLWRVWNAQSVKVDPWQDYHQGVYSWFLSYLPYKCPVEGLVLSFPGFLRQWQEWGESLALVIHWYVESNKHVGGVEGSIIWAQAALELLAWVLLVERGNVDEKDFQSRNGAYYSTSKKINRLLSEFKIPQNIPSELTNLMQFESRLPYSKNNGSYAFTEVRNSITHAAPENRQMFRNTSLKARAEAWELGLWYVELVLLGLFDYQASYSNRILRSRWKGGEQLVPWVSVES